VKKSQSPDKALPSGIALSAKCVNSGDEIVWDKYGKFRSWFFRATSHGVEEVWNTVIRPEDWHTRENRSHNDNAGGTTHRHDELRFG